MRYRTLGSDLQVSAVGVGCMEQNIEVFDFTLDAADMQEIAGLDTQESLFFSHYDPATVEMLTEMG